MLRAQITDQVRQLNGQLLADFHGVLNRVGAVVAHKVAAESGIYLSYCNKRDTATGIAADLVGSMTMPAGRLEATDEAVKALMQRLRSPAEMQALLKQAGVT